MATNQLQNIIIWQMSEAHSENDSYFSSWNNSITQKSHPQIRVLFELDFEAHYNPIKQEINLTLIVYYLKSLKIEKFAARISKSTFFFNDCIIMLYPSVKNIFQYFFKTTKNLCISTDGIIGLGFEIRGQISSCFKYHNIFMTEFQNQKKGVQETFAEKKKNKNRALSIYQGKIYFMELKEDMQKRLMTQNTFLTTQGSLPSFGSMLNKKTEQNSLKFNLDKKEEKGKEIVNIFSTQRTTFESLVTTSTKTATLFSGCQNSKTNPFRNSFPATSTTNSNSFSSWSKLPMPVFGVNNPFSEKKNVDTSKIPKFGNSLPFVSTTASPSFGYPHSSNIPFGGNAFSQKKNLSKQSSQFESKKSEQSINFQSGFSTSNPKTISGIFSNKITQLPSSQRQNFNINQNNKGKWFDGEQGKKIEKKYEQAEKNFESSQLKQNSLFCHQDTNLKKVNRFEDKSFQMKIKYDQRQTKEQEKFQLSKNFIKQLKEKEAMRKEEEEYQEEYRKWQIQMKKSLEQAKLNEEEQPPKKFYNRDIYADSDEQSM